MVKDLTQLSDGDLTEEYRRFSSATVESLSSIQSEMQRRLTSHQLKATENLAAATQKALAATEKTLATTEKMLSSADRMERLTKKLYWATIILLIAAVFPVIDVLRAWLFR